MTFFKESFTTLRLFLWFVAVSNAGVTISLISDLARGLPFDVWIAVSLLLGTVYAAGAAYIAVKIRKLIPQYRAQLVKIVWTLFAIDAAFVLATIITLLMNPLEFDPAFADPTLLYASIVGELVFLGIAYLINLVIVTNINRLSSTASTEPSTQKTLIYWAIFILLLALLFGAIFYDPGTGTLTTELGA